MTRKLIKAFAKWSLIVTVCTAGVFGVAVLIDSSSMRRLFSPPRQRATRYLNPVQDSYQRPREPIQGHGPLDQSFSLQNPLNSYSIAGNRDSLQVQTRQSYPANAPGFPANAPGFAETVAPQSQDSDDGQLTNSANQIARQLQQQRKSNSSESARDDLKASLKAVLTKQFDQRQAVRRKQLEDLKQQASQIEGAIESRDSNRDAIVERRMDELLGRPNELSWDYDSKPNQQQGGYDSQGKRGGYGSLGTPPLGIQSPYYQYPTQDNSYSAPSSVPYTLPIPSTDIGPIPNYVAPGGRNYYSTPNNSNGQPHLAPSIPLTNRNQGGSQGDRTVPPAPFLGSLEAPRLPSQPSTESQRIYQNDPNSNYQSGPAGNSPNNDRDTNGLRKEIEVLKQQKLDLQKKLEQSESVEASDNGDLE